MSNWREKYPKLAVAVDCAISKSNNEYVVNVLRDLDRTYAIDGDNAIVQTIRIIRPNLGSWADTTGAKEYLLHWRPEESGTETKVQDSGSVVQEPGTESVVQEPGTEFVAQDSDPFDFEYFKGEPGEQVS